MSDLIAPHLNAIRAQGLSPLTIAKRERLLRCLARELPHGIDEASTEELQEWLGRKGWATKTRETYWCHMVGFYRWAVGGRRPKMDWDPTEDILRPKPKRRLPRVASDDQLRLCLDVCAHPVRLAVVLAGGVGMRAGEIALAQREDFTERRAIILGKGDKMRAVPIPAEVWAEVEPMPPGPLILRHGQPVTADWVTDTCAAAFDRIGQPRLTIHWFRGAYATRLRRSGVDTLAISRLLGHASVATTQLYVQLDDEDLAVAVRRLPGLRDAAGQKGTGPAEV